MKTITVSEIDIEVIRKDIKNIHLSVHPPYGWVRIAVPTQTKDEAIRLFVVSKLRWIRDQQKEFNEQVRISPREYVAGESHYFLGQRYLLDIEETTGKQHVEIVGKNKMVFHARKNSSVEQRERVMVEWYREELKKVIPEFIKKWEEKMNVEVNDWQIRKMKTKWGSCNVEKRFITINLELAKKHPECIEYIVVHEMVHLLERHHNERFIAYMDQLLPNWRSLRAELNEKVFESHE